MIVVVWTETTIRRWTIKLEWDCLPNLFLFFKNIFVFIIVNYYLAASGALFLSRFNFHAEGGADLNSIFMSDKYKGDVWGKKNTTRKRFLEFLFLFMFLKLIFKNIKFFNENFVIILNFIDTIFN